MASTNKTAHGLNLWVETDKPVMNDFNTDNNNIETALDEKADVSYVDTKVTNATNDIKTGTVTVANATNAQKINNKQIFVQSTAPTGSIPTGSLLFW